jgi:large subunit ribosomal protein L31
MVSKKLVKLHNSQRDNFISQFKSCSFLIMPKSDIHPTWYPDAKVICNGEVVMTTGSTQPEIQVDVWSGNHPFFTGTQKILDTEGRVDRFMRKYGMASSDSSEEKEKSSKEKKES